MHAYFIIRGLKHKLDLWEKYMETRDFPLQYTDPKGKLMTTRVQGALREIKLYEYVFPKEAKDVVLSNLRFDEQIYPPTLKMKIAVKALRAALGAREAEFNKVNYQLLPDEINSDGIQILGIGVKDDKEITTEEGVKQEGL